MSWGKATYIMLPQHSMGIGFVKKSAFLVTIDTEGDNLWAKPRTITTENARYIHRFQALCEEFGLKPTYLNTWEMANCPIFREFGRDILVRNTGEIGMHLHAWNSPPPRPLTSDDYLHQPYLIEYPEQHIRDKVAYITDHLERVFQVKMLSHRAGRWGFDQVYAQALVDHGYCIDCSVAPHVSWRQYLGDPAGHGGPDFSNYPENAYFVDLNHIRAIHCSLFGAPLLRDMLVRFGFRPRQSTSPIVISPGSDGSPLLAEEQSQQWYFLLGDEDYN